MRERKNVERSGTSFEELSDTVCKNGKKTNLSLSILVPTAL
jgi:hypothetical protein